jgi:hypothetical protein
VSGRTPPENQELTGGYASTNGASSKLRSESALRFVVLAYITAFAIPPVGLILGIVIATRPVKSISKHAVWIILISVVAAGVWLLVFESGLLAANSNDLSY